VRVVVAEDDGDEGADGVGVDGVDEPPLVAPGDAELDPELVAPVPDAVEWTDVDAAVTWSPMPYSFRPTVAPMTTRMTVKRTVPRQDLLFMTCSVLLGG
jgi:hypothetical protein